MISRFSKIIVFGILITVFLFSNIKSFAQNSDFSPSEFCPSFVENLDRECEKLGVEKCREYLERCEQYYQQKSAQYQSEISQLQQKKKLP